MKYNTYKVKLVEYWWLQEFLEELCAHRNVKVYTIHEHTANNTVFFHFEKYCSMTNSWTGLTEEEEDELLRAFEERMERYRPKKEKKIECTCELDLLLRAGCKCGAFEKEMKLKKKREAEIEKKIQEDLKKGVPYNERVKKYGRG